MRRLGLIGGTSWESSVHYYAQLNQGVRARLGGIHSADLVLRSVEFAEISAYQEVEDWEGLGRRYAAEGAALAGAGAQVLGILANTMHLLYDDVVAGSGLPVVHIVDAVADVAAAAGYSRVGLLGTRYTMASDLYPTRLAPRGVQTLVPEPADADEVHRIIYAELTRGEVLETSRDAVRAMITRLVDRGAQAVVLGCTELPLLVSVADATVPLLDTTAIHVHALLDAALQPPVPSLEEGAA